ncbi:RNase adapter RapZ [Magnetococcales bacterium HHB-1]
MEQVVLITGLSGAGKSSALHYLEDLGFFWVDNLPPEMIPAFINHFKERSDTTPRLAIGLHLRDEVCLSQFKTFKKWLEQSDYHVNILYLEALSDTIVTRYRATRRRHPIAAERTIEEACRIEKELLFPIRAVADTIIDTTRLTIPHLKSRLDGLYKEGEAGNLNIFLRSFGFKYGTATDADMVFDARFLANPYYDIKLRPLSGQDEAVCQFLEKDGGAPAFLDKLITLFDFLVPRYQEEKKRYLTVDIGCTGGCHRSVFLVEKLAKSLRQKGWKTFVRHRDMKKEQQQYH